jgi:predicted YcjX-like family ATPase
LPQPPTRISDEIGIALGNLADAAAAPFTPTLRLGVTGLSRAGKTIFITALVHALMTGGRLPAFTALSEGRFIGARPPNPPMPRFPASPTSSTSPRLPATTRAGRIPPSASASCGCTSGSSPSAS